MLTAIGMLSFNELKEGGGVTRKLQAIGIVWLLASLLFAALKKAVVRCFSDRLHVVTKKIGSRSWSRVTQSLSHQVQKSDSREYVLFAAHELDMSLPTV